MEEIADCHAIPYSRYLHVSLRIMGDTGKHSSAWCFVFDSFVVILQPVRRQRPENDNKLLPGRNAKSDNNNKRQ